MGASDAYNHPFQAMAHETKIRRWTTFTPPQNTALAAFCGLFLLRRSYRWDLLFESCNWIALAGLDKPAHRFQTQLLCVVHANVHYPA